MNYQSSSFGPPQLSLRWKFQRREPPKYEPRHLAAVAEIDEVPCAAAEASPPARPACLRRRIPAAVVDAPADRLQSAAARCRKKTSAAPVSKLGLQEQIQPLRLPAGNCAANASRFGNNSVQPQPRCICCSVAAFPPVDVSLALFVNQNHAQRLRLPPPLGANCA